MLREKVNNLALRCLILALLVLSLFVLSYDSTKSLLASSKVAQDREKSPTVITESHHDAPLHVLATSVVSTKAQDFKLQVMVQNQSTKNIRAYAITSYTSSDKTQNGYTQFINLTQPHGVWRPTETKTIEISDPQEAPIISVRIVVDFVEFSDNTTWGADASNSRDTLAGQRAGARAEKERVRQLLRDRGREAVIKDIQGDVLPGEMVEPNRSPEWLNGFRSGAGSIRKRLKETLQAGSSTRIELELSKSFDTSEDKQK